MGGQEETARAAGEEAQSVRRNESCPGRAAA